MLLLETDPGSSFDLHVWTAYGPGMEQGYLANHGESCVESALFIFGRPDFGQY